MIKYLLFRNRTVKKGDGLNYRIPRKGEYPPIFLTKPPSEKREKITSDFKTNVYHPLT